jgi:four helix bundle protein
MDEDDDRPERPPTFEDGQDIRDRAFAFACRVVKFCQQLSDGGGVGRLMVPQLLSCTLSFATMLEEARGAESDADFISKCCISLKECRESWTRLRVCTRCQIGPQADARALVQEGNELIAIVTTIIKNKRRNVATKRAAEKAAKSMKAATSQTVNSDRRARAAKPPARAYEFQIPNS